MADFFVVTSVQKTTAELEIYACFSAKLQKEAMPDVNSVLCPAC